MAQERSIRTPLARARGMGSSKHGVGHFIVQRVTAVALVLLVLWALASAMSLASGDYESAANWLRSPLNAGIACLLAFTAFWHMQVGMRVIIEDYLARPATKAVCLILNIFLCWAAGALTILSILKVALSASGVSV
jgi:succinate dehydrogenase / fumarate reductase membrane anchor subunit